MPDCTPAADPTCPTSGRRLLQEPAGSGTVTVSEAQLEEKLKKAFAPFTALKNNVSLRMRVRRPADLCMPLLFAEHTAYIAHLEWYLLL